MSAFPAEAASSVPASDTAGRAVPNNRPAAGSPAVYRVEELMEVLSCGRRQLYEAIQRNEIPGVVRIGRSIRISRAAVEAWLGADIGERVEEEHLEGET